ARCHGRVERIRGTEGAEKVTALAAEFPACIGPERDDAFDILRHIRIQALAGIAAAYVHRHRAAEVAEAGVEFRAQRACPRTCARVGRPYPGPRGKLMQPFRDCERVPGGKAAAGL